MTGVCLLYRSITVTESQYLVVLVTLLGIVPDPDNDASSPLQINCYGNVLTTRDAQIIYWKYAK